MSAIPELHAVSPSEAFDNVAAIFDETFENEITKHFREKIYHLVESLAGVGSSILDINCGTGIDALALVRRGYNVLGIDVAPKMIELANVKAVREKVSALKFLHGSFEQITDKTDNSYDLVLSNFGGLNCVERLASTANQVALVTKPGGYFVATVMPPVCLWDIVSGLARFNIHAAFRRLSKNAAATGFRGKTFTVYYHTLNQLLSAFSPWFEPKQVLGLNIISPPPHATTFLRQYKKLSRWLENCDRVFASMPGLRATGDHYLVVLRRKPS